MEHSSKDTDCTATNTQSLAVRSGTLSIQYHSKQNGSVQTNIVLISTATFTIRPVAANSLLWVFQQLILLSPPGLITSENLSKASSLKPIQSWQLYAHSKGQLNFR